MRSYLIALTYRHRGKRTTGFLHRHDLTLRRKCDPYFSGCWPSFVSSSPGTPAGVNTSS